jgi:hypothetical protein
VRARVADDKMDVERLGDDAIDRIEGRSKLAPPVALVELPDDVAALGIQAGQERRRPVARVAVGPTLGLLRSRAPPGFRVSPMSPD